MRPKSISWHRCWECSSENKQLGIEGKDSPSSWNFCYWAERWRPSVQTSWSGISCLRAVMVYASSWQSMFEPMILWGPVCSWCGSNSEPGLARLQHKAPITCQFMILRNRYLHNAASASWVQLKLELYLWRVIQMQQFDYDQQGWISLYLWKHCWWALQLL